MDQPANEPLSSGASNEHGTAVATDKIVLVVRSRLFREGLGRMLRAAKFEVVAEVSKTNEFPDLQALSTTPSLVLVEASFALAESFLIRLRRALPTSRIVLLANTKELLSLKKTQLIDNIVSSDITGRFLMQVLRSIPPGQCAVTLNTIQSLLETRAAGYPGRLGGEEQAPSRRETEILCCLIDGYSNKVIARRLGITEATVKVHLKGLLRKISAANRTQAAIWALNNGIRGTNEAQLEPGLGLPGPGAQPEQTARGSLPIMSTS